jgi:hypothetical protein
MSVCLASCALGAGCAPITSGKSQSLTIQATCGGEAVVDASCSLRNSKGQWIVKTPGSVTIHKAYGDLAVECSKQGLETSVGVFESSSNGGVWGNLVVGGLVGYAIDAGSGAGFDYPQQLTMTFNPPCEAAPEAKADAS